MTEQKLRVAFISRPTLFSVKGGDTVQMQNTATALRKLGVEVNIHTSDSRIDYGQYDLLHFFNLIRPATILAHCQKSGLPYVVSPIYVDYSEYESRHGGPMRKWLMRALNKHRMEYLKAWARRIRNGEPMDSYRYILLGHKGSIKRVLKYCSLLLPNSESEMARIRSDFGKTPPYTVVPNAIDPVLFEPGVDAERQKNLVLCVARIEGRKNQLELIRAVKGSGLRLILIGDPAPNHLAYYRQCQEEAGEEVEILPAMEQDQLLHYYRTAQVHALPSWFETTGLSSLEAAICGCRIVVGQRGDVKDYFGEDAIYCEPGSTGSIREALLQAAASGTPQKLQERISRKYTWDECGRITHSAYERVLSCG